MSPSLPDGLDEGHVRLIQLYTRAVVHALNNCLSGVSGYQQLLALRFQREGSPEDEKVTEYLTEMEKSLLEAEALLRDLSAWAKPASTKPAPIDLAPLVREAVDRFLERHPDTGDRVVRNIAEGLPPAPADEGLLGKYLDAILENAWLATRENGGKIEVALERDERGGELPAEQRVTVRDEGCGLDEERKPFFRLPVLAAFHPDHTCREGWSGRGFGLPRAYSCARSMGGRMSVEGAPGGGTTVTLALPEDSGAG
jgi:signal transduction histidine kinase